MSYLLYSYTLIVQGLDSKQLKLIFTFLCKPCLTKFHWHLFLLSIRLFLFVTVNVVINALI